TERFPHYPAGHLHRRPSLCDHHAADTGGPGRISQAHPGPAMNPLKGFRVEKHDLQFVGSGLQRPECILAEPDGTLWSAEARGGVMRVAPDGTQALIAQQADSRFAGTADLARRFTEGTLPNGLAFARNGDFLIANFGTDCLEV